MSKNKKRADGRVQKRVCIGTVNGVKRYKSVYGRTDAEAERKAQEIRRRLGNGERIEAGEQSFRTWAERLIQMKDADLSPTYYRTLKGQCTWWCERLGDLPINEVLTSDLQDGINELYSAGRSKKTLTDYRNTAHAIIELAERDRAVTYNPARFVTIPRNAEKTARFALTEEEQGWILTTPHRARLAAILMMYAGLRRGELLALNVADVDLREGVIHVNKSIRYMEDGNTPELKRGGKTDAATRTVPITAVLREILAEELIGRSPFEVLIAGNDGRYMTQSAFERMWESYLSVLNEQHGQSLNGKRRSRFAPGGIPVTIRHFTPHCLRHTYATILHAAGVDVLTAQEWIGHTDAKTTLSIYTHLEGRTAARDVDLLDRHLHPSSREEKTAAES